MNVSLDEPQVAVSDEDSCRSYPVKLLLIPALVLLSVLLAGILSNSGYVNYDCAYYLLCARMLLIGKQPIVDVVDLLPPIIFYFSMPAWWLAQLLGLSIAPAFNLLVFAGIALSCLVCVYTLRQARFKCRNDWVACGPLLYSFMLFNLIVGFHFGQREHLFVLAMFPLFILRWLRFRQALKPSFNSAVAIGCGFATGLIVFVKPQLALVPICLEAYFRLHASHRRQWLTELKAPELLSFASTLVGCFAASFLIPNIFVYYQRWVPFVSKGYTAHFADVPAILFLFGSPDGQMLGSRAVALIAFVSAYFIRHRLSLIAPLMVWTLAAFVVYVGQGRGWSYQAIPFVCGYLMLTGVLLVVIADWMLSELGEWLPTLKARIGRMLKDASEVGQRRATLVLLIHALLLLPLSTVLVENSRATARTFHTLDTVVTSHSRPGDTVVILHTLLPYAHQLQLSADRVPGCRYIWCFPLRMTKSLEEKLETKDQARADERRVVAEIRDDLGKSKPKLIAIEAWADSSGWSLLNCLASHGFMSWPLLRDYEPVGREGNFAVWKRVRG